MKKKGFTLIELLAVIIVLAIIALIATPIIMRVIERSRKETAERSIESYGKAVDLEVMKYKLDHSTESIIGQYKSSDDGKKILTLEGEEVLEVDYKGNEVKCDTIRIYSDSTVGMKNCSVQGIEYEYKYGAKRACTEGIDKDENKIVTCGDEKFYVMNDYLEDVPTGEIIVLSNKRLNNQGIEFSATLYEYTGEYEQYLKNTLNITSASVGLMSYDQAKALGSPDGVAATTIPKWLKNYVPYWIGSLRNNNSAYFMWYDGGIYSGYVSGRLYNVRPIVMISVDDID